MQLNRLFEIVYILLEKKNVTAKYLAERFEVSARTIYRDVEALSEAGIPVYMTKGKGGGIGLLPDFVLNKAVLTEKEKSEVLSALQGFHAMNNPDEGGALSKLGSLFGKQNQNWIEIDFSDWSTMQNGKNLFNKLKDAILNRKVISFQYFSVKGEISERTVEPLKLAFKGQSWYLYGYCRKRADLRFFKLSRIKQLVEDDEAFTRTAPDQIFQDESHIFSEENVWISLKIARKMAYRVYDEFEAYEIDKDGDFLVKLIMPKGEWIYGYLLSYGDGVEILEPPEARDNMKNILKSTLKHYLI